MRRISAVQESASNISALARKKGRLESRPTILTCSKQNTYSVGLLPVRIVVAVVVTMVPVVIVPPAPIVILVALVPVAIIAVVPVRLILPSDVIAFLGPTPAVIFVVVRIVHAVRPSRRASGNQRHACERPRHRQRTANPPQTSHSKHFSRSLPGWILPVSHELPPPLISLHYDWPC